MFSDAAFDTVLCLSALQMMKNVEAVLRDITRVGQEAIVSFPNFAHWPHRIALLSGRMPVSDSLPYAWYDTPNLRFATISDFEELGFLDELKKTLKNKKPVKVFVEEAKPEIKTDFLVELHQEINMRSLREKSRDRKITRKKLRRAKK